MTKYKINIENNSNKGDIIINIPEDKDQYSSDYWIKKGNTCAKNLNWQGAFNCYQEATCYNCSENQLYYCYNQMADLLDNSIDKKYYLAKIWNLKTVKKTKKDYLRYIFININLFIEKYPLLFIILVLLVSFYNKIKLS